MQNISVVPRIYIDSNTLVLVYKNDLNYIESYDHNEGHNSMQYEYYLNNTRKLTVNELYMYHDSIFNYINHFNNMYINYAKMKLSTKLINCKLLEFSTNQTKNNFNSFLLKYCKNYNNSLFNFYWNEYKKDNSYEISSRHSKTNNPETFFI